MADDKKKDDKKNTSAPKPPAAGEWNIVDVVGGKETWKTIKITAMEPGHLVATIKHLKSRRANLKGKSPGAMMYLSNKESELRAEAARRGLTLDDTIKEVEVDEFVTYGGRVVPSGKKKRVEV